MKKSSATIVLLGVFLGSFSLAQAVSILTVQQGGTGWGYPGGLQSGTLLTGNGTNAIATTTIGSGLSLSGGVLSATASSVYVATSSLAATYPVQVATSTSAITYSLAFGTTTQNTWASTQTFTNPLIDGTLSGLIGGNSGLTYAVSTSTISFGYASTTQISSTGSAYFAMSGGNVGIASTTPWRTLDINGTVGMKGLTTGAGAGALCLTANNEVVYSNNAGCTGAGSGTVTSIVAGSGLNGGTITTSGTLSLSSYIATSTAETAGQLAVWGTTSGWPAKVYSIATSSLSVSSSLLSSGTLGSQVGGTASSLSLNLANSNWWTALQHFTTATTSQFEATSTAWFDGETIGTDMTNSYTGRLSPTRSFVLSVATTTEWTASTTSSGYTPFLVMPFAGTLQDTRCLVNGTSTALFLGVNTQVNGSNATPSYFVASSSIGKMTFTAGNTFSAGQKILANFGTTTISDAQGIACTYDVVETP